MSSTNESTSSYGTTTNSEGYASTSTGGFSYPSTTTGVDATTGSSPTPNPNYYYGANVASSSPSTGSTPKLVQRYRAVDPSALTYSESNHIASGTYNIPTSPSNATTTTSAFPLSRSSLVGSAQKAPAIGYQHSKISGFYLSILIGIILLSHETTTIPFQVFLLTCLVLYGFDLWNNADLFQFALWIGVFINTCCNGWCWLILNDDAIEEDGDDGWFVLEIIFKLGTTAITFILAACWILLHIQSHITDDDENQFLSLADLESTIHATIPPLFATFGCQFIVSYILDDESEFTAYFTPYIFIILLSIGMLTIGSSRISKFHVTTSSDVLNNSSNGNSKKDDDNKEIKKISVTNNVSIKDYAIRYTGVVKVHLALLLIMPFIIHSVIFVGHARYRSAFVLTLLIPYIIVFILHNNNSPGAARHHPYDITTAKSSTVLRTSLKQYACCAVAILLSSVVIQQQFLVPLCRSFAYHILGKHVSEWILSLYWILATILFIFTFWLWGRPSTSGIATAGSTAPNESPGGAQQTKQGSHGLMFDEYHEDIIQICLSLTGLCLGKAFGLPWNMIPLPVLSLIGISMWITSRMVRYLCIVLFVFHASCVVIFTYKYVGIEQKITFPLGYTISLLHFALTITATSIVIGLVTGFAIRSKGGFMSSLVKRFDVTGQLFTIYIMLLTLLEITLYKLPSVNSNELIGVETEEVDALNDDDNTLYNPYAVYVTSLTAIAISIFMNRHRMMFRRCTSIVIAFSFGKAVAVLVDDKTDATTTGNQVLFQATITAFLCLIIYSPRLFLKPVHRKLSTSARYRGGIGSSGRGGTDLPKSAIRTIVLYTFVVLPLALIGTIPYVLFPLVSIFTTNDSYHKVRTPTSEVIGAIIAVWGLSCLSMLNYYLPDSGGEVWKKLSALSFLIGTTIFFAAPTLGMTVMTDIVSNPYSSLSSVGAQLISRSKSRTGGWGLSAATVAVLLAVAGPLELRERHIPGRKDSYLLFRTMTFSLLFGGGIAWFVTVICMSETSWLFLFLTLVSSMVVSFLGTIAAVFGHYLELENFHEVEQLATVAVFVFGALSFVAGIPQIVGFRSSRLFGSGGWLSTYLIISGLSTLGFAVAVSKRNTKDSRTQGLGNIACLISWLSAIIALYGSFGITGVVNNYETRTIVGMPLSVLGTIAVSPILLLLEGESSHHGASRSRISISKSTKPTSYKGIFSLNLARLNDSNRWFIPFLGTIAVLLSTSLYVVILRGFPGGNNVVKTSEELYNNIFGSAVRDRYFVYYAKKTLSQSIVLAAAARLAESGFWTASGITGPLLHLVGIVLCFPTLYRLITEWWFDQAVPTSQILLSLPLNSIPLLLCRGIPGLQAAAFGNVVAAFHHAYKRHRNEQASRAAANSY